MDGLQSLKPLAELADATEQELLDQLPAAGRLYEQTQAYIRGLCMMIGNRATDDDGAAIGGPKPVPTRRVAARAPRKKGEPAAGGEKKDGRAAAPGSPEYWKKVTCLECGAETGSRVYEGERFPVLHKDATTGETCKGSFAAVPEKD